MHNLTSILRNPCPVIFRSLCWILLWGWAGCGQAGWPAHRFCRCSVSVVVGAGGGWSVGGGCPKTVLQTVKNRWFLVVSGDMQPQASGVPCAQVTSLTGWW